MNEASSKEILSQVEEEDVLSLAKNLIKIPSFTTEETKCAQYLYKYFRKNGFSAQLQRVETGRYQTIARLKGSGKGRSLMFNGHIDIDPLGSGWTRNPWKPAVEKGCLYGAGIFNMKAGVTAMIKAAEALKRSKAKLKGDLLIACVAGELQAGVGTVHLLKSGVHTDMAVVTEPYGAHNIMTTHAGAFDFALSTFGVTKHISEMEKGVSAIDKMVKVIQTLQKVKFTHDPFPKLPGLPRMLVGSVIGGRGEKYELKGPYFVPDICTVYADVRMVPGMTPETVRADIESALKKLCEEDPNLRYEFEWPPKPERGIAKEAMLATDVPVDSFIVKSLKQNHRIVTGLEMDNIGAMYPMSYSGNDTAHLWRAGIECCLYGPGGEFLPEQSVPVNELMTCTKVLALTALEVCA